MTDWAKFINSEPKVEEVALLHDIRKTLNVIETRAAQTNALLAALLDATNLNVSTVSEKEDHHGKETTKSKKRK